MLRGIKLVLLIVLLIACGAPAAAPAPTWTPEAPKKVGVTIEIPPTATAELTYTPIPATFTRTATSTRTNTPTSTTTNTATATRLVTKAPTWTLGPTRTLLPTRTIGPTRTPKPTNTPRSTSIPTVFLPATDTPEPVVIQPSDTPGARVCCKICRAGKACGDSCISRDKTCNKGKGCACDG